jgi:hypothetical protein
VMGGRSDPWSRGCPGWAGGPAPGEVEGSESCPEWESGSGLGSESESKSRMGSFWRDICESERWMRWVE